MKINIAIVGVALLILFYLYGRAFWVPVYQKVVGKETVSSVIEKYGENAENRLKPYFDNVGISYPPKEVKLLAIKDEKKLELWASSKDGFKKIKNYPVRAASGIAGPKLMEGDKQVPEGIYKIMGLNPNSSYHLSMKLNYPNEFDLYHANNEGRSNPGTNIFIHGKEVSIGCLAIGDSAIEELFTLVYKVGTKNTEVVISPSDPRKAPLFQTVGDEKPWIAKLYKSITTEFIKYREI
ncbi:Glutamate synthase [NADPH] large chain [hydrothermal vent metagenome]|uniref:Glutamate synthase [NADPH] large chain n=1 Tax=hydrothermal vent metagenome TaxID=652676 RepID=A0A3B0Z8C3_9ZZZZ